MDTAYSREDLYKEMGPNYALNFENSCNRIIETLAEYTTETRVYSELKGVSLFTKKSLKKQQ